MDFSKLQKIRGKIEELSKESEVVLTVACDETRAMTPEEDAKVSAIETELAGLRSTENTLIKHMSGEEQEEFRALTTRQTIYDPETTRSNEKVPSLGICCMNVRNAELHPGGEVPNWMREQRAILGQSEQIPADGGYLVPAEHATGIQENMWTQGTLLSRVTHRTLAGDSLLMDNIKENSRADGSRYGGVRAYWEAEGDSTTASKMVLEQSSISLNQMMATVYATDKLLQDVTQLESKIMETVPKEMMFRAEDGIIRGTGAGQMLGILSNSGSYIEVAAENNQGADTVVTENILNMYRSRFGSNWTWIYNQELEDQLELMTIAVGTGGELARLFVPPQNPGAEATIKGRPAFAVEQCSGAGDVGDIMLGDFSQYTVGEKTGGIQTASSIHVQFLTAQNCFRFIWRITGQPNRNSNITPYKRTDTDFYLSPFEAIAAR